MTRGLPIRHAGSALLVALVQLACTGDMQAPADDRDRDEQKPDDGAGGSAGTDPACPTGAACGESSEAVVMRRLTRAEYDNTVRDLLGIDTLPARAFPAEEIVKGFDNNARALSFPHLLAEQAMAAAVELGRAAATRASRWAPCAAKAADANCARVFIEELGLRAWRRPLSDAEVDRLAAVFAEGDGFEDGAGLAAQALFISVPFFYRIERGDRARPTSFEMASRLSYLLWNSLPDDELLEAAAADRLRDEADVMAQLDRMLGDQRARRTFANFNRQWLTLAPIGLAAKDPDAFAAWRTEYAHLLRESAERMVADIAEQGDFDQLFVGARVFVNDELAPYYGVEPPGSQTMVALDLADPERQAGLLTQGGLLVSLSGFSSTSPTFRGKFVREHLLCGTLPPPPPDVKVMIGPAPEGQTTREHYQQHIDNPQCAGCHKPMDPIGFAFEGYDAVGQPRKSEHGKAIDARGEAFDSDVGAFEGVRELGERLAQSEDVKRCVARQWFRYAFGRLEGRDDEATLSALTASLDKENSHRGLMQATVAAAEFRRLASP